jgi:hypothetical protein
MHNVVCLFYFVQKMPKSDPLPPGVYVAMVTFFDNNEELDLVAVKAHVLRLANVRGWLFTFFKY